MIVDINDVLFLMYRIMNEDYSLYDLAVGPNLVRMIESFEGNINIKLTKTCRKDLVNQLKDKKDYPKGIDFNLMQKRKSFVKSDHLPGVATYRPNYKYTHEKLCI